MLVFRFFKVSFIPYYYLKRAGSSSFYNISNFLIMFISLRIVRETLLVNGGWNRWSPWSICTKAVSGIQIRFRECSDPEPAYGGEHCNGSRALVRECNKMSSCHEGNI